LFDLYNAGHISYDEAIRNADSANELRLQIKLRGERGHAGEAQSTGFDLALDEEKEEEEEEKPKK
jgi:twitching motility protein PilU